MDDDEDSPPSDVSLVIAWTWLVTIVFASIVVCVGEWMGGG